MSRTKAKRNEVIQKVTTLKIKAAQLVYGYEEYLTTDERDKLHRIRCELANMALKMKED